MLKKTIKYKDLDNNIIEEDFYFNISMPEILDMAAKDENLVERLQRIVKEDDRIKIMSEFAFFTKTSVGRREGNTRFVKSPEITQEFVESDAYSVMLWELVTNAEFAAQFINSAFPSQLSEEFTKLQNATVDPKVVDGEAAVAEVKKFEDFSRDELLNMPQEQFDNLLAPVHQRTRDQLVIGMQRMTKS